MIRVQRCFIRMTIFLAISASLICCTANQPAAHSPTVVQASVSVPVSFSPNGDGMDDTWNIDGLAAYPAAEINLFTLYGLLVYSSTGVYHPWNGVYKGETVPSGKYYYVIKKAKKTRVIDGWMQLIR